MSSIHYDKLVRDKIPEIIIASGKRPVADLLPAEDMPAALDRKLMEEMQEFFDSRRIEEMAEILEVLHGIAFISGVSWDAVERERIRKREERGGFEKGIRLLRVEDV